MNAQFFSLPAACVAALITNGTAYAATQGSLGTTSTGSISIGASVPNRVQISGLADVSFANQDPATPAASAQNVCVWSNTSTKGYNITASGSGAGSAFTLASGASTVPYDVEWSGSSGQSSGTALTSGSALTGLTSTASSATCSSGPGSSASLIVRISTANLQTMQAAAAYTGTLTLVVAPE
ncbi:MAG TPA: hypothetical protein VJ775_02900 [Sphingomicrobium sp.]|nr:hypothetical protein [Sphingomicrobium sp.]